MIFKLQLEVEIDTTTKQTRVVNPILQEGAAHLCPHCQKPIPLNVQYCNAACFRAHGTRTRRPNVRVVSPAVEPSLSLAVPAQAIPDYRAFTFPQV